MRRQRNRGQMKEQNNQEKKLNKMEIANSLDAEFKTLVIRMLREIIEYCHKIKEEMKVTLSEIKKNPQETNSEGREAKIQINDLEQKKEMNIQPEQNGEKEFKKTRRGLGTSGTLSVPTPNSQGCQKEKRKSKKLKIYLKKIMKENFPNLVKEIHIQVQAAQRVPNKLDPKRATARHILIKMPKVKDKERILKAAREPAKMEA